MLGSSYVYKMGDGYICRAESKDAVVREIHTPSYGFYVKKGDASEEIKNLMESELESLKFKKEGIEETIRRIKNELKND